MTVIDSVHIQNMIDVLGNKHKAIQEMASRAKKEIIETPKKAGIFYDFLKRGERTKYSDAFFRGNTSYTKEDIYYLLSYYDFIEEFKEYGDSEVIESVNYVYFPDLKETIKGYYKTIEEEDNNDY